MMTVEIKTTSGSMYMNFPPCEHAYSMPFFDKNQNWYELQFVSAHDVTETILMDDLNDGVYANEYANWVKI